MNKIIASVILLGLIGCNSKFSSAPECSLNGNTLVCNGKTLVLKDGQNGESGTNGLDGINGSNGTNGVDGQSGLFVKIVDPCGQETSFDEVILVTRDGDYLAYFAGTDTTTSRLAMLDIGNTYITTDGTSCIFKVTSNGIEW